MPEEVHLGIVGAGAAGFSCAARARELWGTNVRITMLEARDRIGGRILTTNIDGEVIQDVDGDGDNGPVLDFGAQWAHNFQGLEGEVRLKDVVEATKTEVSVAESWDMKEESLILWKTRFPEATDEEVRQLDSWCEPLLEKTVLKWELICKQEGFDLPKTNALDVLDYCLRPGQIEGWFAENKDKGNPPSAAAIALAREHQMNMFSNYFGIEAHVTSYESLDEDESGHEHRCITNGYFRVVDHLRKKAANSLTIKLEREVLRIDQEVTAGGTGGVQVTWRPAPSSSEREKEQTETFDFVVCTVPLGVLQANRITFCPPLPASIQHSIDKLGCGLLHKTFLLWSEEDWPAVSLPGTRIIYPTAHKETFSFCLNLAEERYHGPGLRGYCAYACYPWASQAEVMTKDELLAAFMSLLNEALGATSKQGGEGENELPAPSKVLVSDWLHDPYALCGYSAQLVGSTLADFDTFSATDYGNVYFAGEHCQSEMYGCVQAALCTGHKAAGRIYERC